MNKYRILKEAITDLNSPMEVDWAMAKDHVKSVLDAIADPGKRAQYIADLKKEFEEAMADPEFDWVKTATETRFIPTIPGDTTWPYNYEDGVIKEFKSVFFTFLYPESELTREDLSHLFRVVVFLVLEAKDIAEWIHYKTLLEQLSTMKPAWQHLDYFHFNTIYDYRGLLDFKWDFTDSGKNAVRISTESDMERSMLSFKTQLQGIFDNPYEGWPPFQDNPSAPYYLQYSKEKWFETVRANEVADLT